MIFLFDARQWLPLERRNRANGFTNLWQTNVLATPPTNVVSVPLTNAQGYFRLRF